MSVNRTGAPPAALTATQNSRLWRPRLTYSEADRADHRIDTGADRSPWPLLCNGDVPLMRVESLASLVDRHLYLARCGSWVTGRRVDGAVSDQEQRSAGCHTRTEPPHHLDH